MNEPRWINRRALLYLHSASLAAHGGAPGIRDEGIFDSALARPVNRFQYDPDSDIAALAAAYGYGLAQNHPFVDGNKRAAFHAVGLFLSLNDFELTAEQVDAIQTVFGVAAGQISEEEFAGWIRARIQRRG